MAETQRLLLSCEHGGNEIPLAWAALFRGHEDLLTSHRGWDPGALPLAERLARALRAPLHRATVTRLLVELNRSPNHPRLFSELSRGLPAAEKKLLLERYYRPYRQAVEKQARDLVRKGFIVVHLAVHSFTPIFDGTVRNADIGLLYDPGRPRERSFCDRWRQLLAEIDKELRVRRNYPYRGTSDSLVTFLRRLLPAERYLGLELEINQKHAKEEELGRVGEAIEISLGKLLPRSLGKNC